MQLIPTLGTHDRSMRVTSQVAQSKTPGTDNIIERQGTPHKPDKLKTRLVAYTAWLLASAVCAGAALSAQMAMDSGMRTVLLIFGVMALLLSVAVGVLLIRRMWATLREIDAVMCRLAAGDLSEKFLLEARGELGGLGRTIQALEERLFTIVSKSRLGATSIAATAGMISGDNAALSSRTEAQASSLEETSSTMEELTSTVKQNSDNAQHANTLVSVVARQAETGGKAVVHAVQKMEAIQASSRKIGEITGVIDVIAFQTNILALNAAVEAARAGSEGRGFAVVAAAVRELAQRSANAAKEIKSIIEESAKTAQTGVDEVSAAGAAIGELVCGVRQVASIMGEIAQACVEQSTGIEEINRAILNLDEVTQKNANLVEAASVTAAGLREQAVGLTDAVSVFRLGKREYGNADDAVALVKAGVAFAREHGTDALIDDVRTLWKSGFVDRDLYFSINHIGGKCLANGANPRFVGNDGNQTQDSEGKYFVREILGIARRDGFGWVDYKYPHPVTRRLQLKSTYFERVADIVITCGFYKQAESEAPSLVPGNGIPKARETLPPSSRTRDVGRETQGKTIQFRAAYTRSRGQPTVLPLR